MHPSHPMKPFALPTDWTPDQAMAVIDLLDELRCHLWAKYQIPLLEHYRRLYGDDLTCKDDSDEPFIEDPIGF